MYTVHQCRCYFLSLHSLSITYQPSPLSVSFTSNFNVCTFFLSVDSCILMPSFGVHRVLDIPRQPSTYEARYWVILSAYTCASRVHTCHLPRDIQQGLIQLSGFIHVGCLGISVAVPRYDSMSPYRVLSGHCNIQIKHSIIGTRRTPGTIQYYFRMYTYYIGTKE